MSDPNILRWLEETDSDSENHLNAPELPNEDCSDVEDVPEDHIIDGECQSDSEVEGDESEFQPIENNIVPPMMEESSSDDDVPLSRHRNFFGKNRFRWSAHPPVSRSRTMQHNIIQQPPGLKPNFRGILHSNTKALDLWSLFLTEGMLEQIVKHTNEKIMTIRQNYQKETSVHDLDVIELKDFIGMLYYTAIFKENHTARSKMFDILHISKNTTLADGNIL